MSSSILYLARGANAVQAGFIAAGVTVSMVAAAQTVIIVMNWITGTDARLDNVMI